MPTAPLPTLELVLSSADSIPKQDPWGQQRR